MAKTRSPGYPAIGLKEAIEKVTAIWSSDYQNPIPRAVAADHMGYASLNGKSLGVLSALLKYGLLEGRGDETRVSDRAVTIIAHAPGDRSRATAVREAASGPDLFTELDARFQGGKASDQAIRSYLITQKFIPSAADSAIRAYRETKQLVEAESVGYSPPEVDAVGDDVVAGQTLSQGHREPPPPPPPLAGDPYRFTFSNSGGIEITGRLTTAEAVDDLVRSLQAMKPLLQRGPVPPGALGQTVRPSLIGGARSDDRLDRTASAPESESAGVKGVPFMITEDHRETLRQMGHTDEQIRHMTPEEAHKLLGLFG